MSYIKIFSFEQMFKRVQRLYRLSDDCVHVVLCTYAFDITANEVAEFLSMSKRAVYINLDYGKRIMFDFDEYVDKKLLKDALIEAHSRYI